MKMKNIISEFDTDMNNSTLLKLSFTGKAGDELDFHFNEVLVRNEDDGKPILFLPYNDKIIWEEKDNDNELYRTCYGLECFLTNYMNGKYNDSQHYLEKIRQYVTKFTDCLLKIQKEDKNEMKKFLGLKEVSLLIFVKNQTKKIGCRFLRPKLVDTNSNENHLDRIMKDLSSFGNFLKKYEENLIKNKDDCRNLIERFSGMRIE